MLGTGCTRSPTACECALRAGVGKQPHRAHGGITFITRPWFRHCVVDDADCGNIIVPIHAILHIDCQVGIVREWQLHPRVSVYNVEEALLGHGSLKNNDAELLQSR